MLFNYLGLGVLPLIILGFVLYGLVKNTALSYMRERNLETARRASNEIYLFIQEPLTILKTLVQTTDILDGERFTQSRLVNKIKEENRIFQRIFILDQQGTIVVTTNFGEEGKNLKETNAFRMANNNETFIKEVDFTPSKFPYMLVALPIQKYNLVEGVLVGEVDLKSIWELVDDITIDSTGRAFLLSSDGSLIAHPDKQKVLQRESYSEYPFYTELMAGREGTSQFEIDDQKYITAFAPITIKYLKWGIVIQQSSDEAFQLATKMQERVVFFVILTALLAIILAVAGIKKITNPLDVLVKDVREYARGNLDHRTTLNRQDELGELAYEFNAMAESLDKNQKKLGRMERLAALSQFASLVSHEIRNPLNAMNINMQILRRLLMEENSPPEKKMKYMNIISTEINRMNSLVTNFLTISRPPELNLIKSDIHRILEEVILLQEAQAVRKNIQIFRQYHGNLCLGMFDHNQLKQVFHNLLLNAFDAMPNGGKLWIKTYPDGNGKEDPSCKRYVLIEFKDTGIGIPLKKINEIFEFYYTTKKTGTGLGLALAKQIIEGHKGSIRVESKLDQGSTLFIRLPINP
jgi:signal transduction histidine kinase